MADSELLPFMRKPVPGGGLIAYGSMPCRVVARFAYNWHQRYSELVTDTDPAREGSRARSLTLAMGGIVLAALTREGPDDLQDPTAPLRWVPITTVQISRPSMLHIYTCMFPGDIFSPDDPEEASAVRIDVPQADTLEPIPAEVEEALTQRVLGEPGPLPAGTPQWGVASVNLGEAGGLIRYLSTGEPLASKLLG